MDVGSSLGKNNMTVDIKAQDTEDLVAVAKQFTFQGQVTEVKAFGSGNINDTFLVTLAASGW